MIFTLLLLVTTLIPGEQYMIQNASSGMYLTTTGDLTTQESEAANWRLATNDTIGAINGTLQVYIYSDSTYMALYNTGIVGGNTGVGGWNSTFIAAPNSTVIRSSATTPGAYNFSYSYGWDTQYMAGKTGDSHISTEASNWFYSLTEASDWYFVPTTHPSSYRYYLTYVNSADGYTKYTLNYLSHDVAGDPCWLSGWLAVPTSSKGGLCSADHVLFSTHYTMTINSDVPSQAAIGPYDALTWNLLSNKPIYFEPDYYGYGSTVGLRHPYCAPDIMAEQCIDMFYGVYDLIRDHHRTNLYQACLPTYGIGYSQGGSIILACQKYVETVLDSAMRQSINWIHTCSGAGPYDPLATISQYYYQDYISMPFAAPLLVMGMVSAYPEIFGEYKAEDYFSDAFNAAHIIDVLDSKSLTIDQVNNLISTTCGSMNMSDMLSDSAKCVNSQMTQCLLKSMGMANLCRDWCPQAEIWFFHNTDDDVVPYLNTISAYNQLRAAQFEQLGYSNINLHTTGIGMSHLVAAIDFMARMLLGGYRNTITYDTVTIPLRLQESLTLYQNL